MVSVLTVLDSSEYESEDSAEETTKKLLEQLNATGSEAKAAAKVGRAGLSTACTDPSL